MADEILKDAYKRLKRSKWGRSLIAGACIVVLVFAVWSSLPDDTKKDIIARLASPKKTTSEQKAPALKSPGAVPQAREAPIVTFKDGKRASVAFAVTTHIEEADAARVVATSGTADGARDSIDPRVLSAVIDEMEKRTIAEVRQSRAEIENVLRVRLEGEFKKVGLTLDAISLKGIDEL